MHASSLFSVNIKRFYGKQENVDLDKYTELDSLYNVDYTIEDAKANVKIRIGQSKFRKYVLENFGYKCCISNITEQPFLIASHIIPWAANKNYRCDPSNGLLLYTEYDSLFDKGYISIDEDLNVLITDRIESLSTNLKKRLEELKGKKVNQPTVYKLKPEYIRYHNIYVFNKFEET